MSAQNLRAKVVQSPLNFKWPINQIAIGFNYAYRRTATNNNATPNTYTTPLPPSNSNAANAIPSQQPTKGSTPVPDRPIPPHLASNTVKSTSSTPAQRSAAASPTLTGDNVPKTNGSVSNEKADAKNKKKEKQIGKKEAAKEKEAKGKTEVNGENTPDAQRLSMQEPLTPTLTEGNRIDDDPKSPTEGSTGTRTPKSGKPLRHPWTIFMRMHVQSVTEADVKKFFGESAAGVRRKI